MLGTRKDDPCLYPGCPRLVGPKGARGLCRSHHQQWRKGKPIPALPPAERVPNCTIDGCVGKVRSRGMCQIHYNRWLRHGDPLTVLMIRGDDVARFWTKVDRRGDADCWPWLGRPDDDGYGTFRVGARMLRAHRYSYELLVDLIPEGLVIDHLCRNRICVNPRHLDPVTNHVNVTVRGMAPTSLNMRKTHCVNGHAFTPENTRAYTKANGRIHRSCKACGRERDRGRAR